MDARWNEAGRFLWNEAGDGFRYARHRVSFRRGVDVCYLMFQESKSGMGFGNWDHGGLDAIQRKVVTQWRMQARGCLQDCVC